MNRHPTSPYLYPLRDLLLAFLAPLQGGDHCAPLKPRIRGVRKCWGLGTRGLILPFPHAASSDPLAPLFRAPWTNRSRRACGGTGRGRDPPRPQASVDVGRSSMYGRPAVETSGSFIFSCKTISRLVKSTVAERSRQKNESFGANHGRNARSFRSMSRTGSNIACEKTYHAHASRVPTGGQSGDGAPVPGRPRELPRWRVQGRPLPAGERGAARVPWGGRKPSGAARHRPRARPRLRARGGIGGGRAGSGASGGSGVAGAPRAGALPRARPAAKRVSTPSARGRRPTPPSAPS